MHDDGKWRITCWVHARPVAAFLAWFGYCALMGIALSAFVLAAIGAGLDEPEARPLVGVGLALTMLVGAANWAIARYAARAGLRRLQHLRTLPPPPGIP